MLLCAAASAALGVLCLYQTHLGRWKKAAACACALGALYPIAALASSRRRTDDGPPRLADVPACPSEVYLGRGYDWTPTCARGLREAAVAGRPPADPESADLRILERELEKHLLILGTTGSGKTRMLELLIAQAIRRGDATAIIDPKGDERLLARVLDECRRAGRTLQLVAPPWPQASAPYNPLAQFADVREVADRIAALLPAGGDAEPFRCFAWEVAHATSAAMHAIGEPLTLASLKRYALDEPWELVRKCVDPALLRGRDLRRAAELHARKAGPEFRSLLSLAGRPVEHTQKMTSALLPLLSKLTAGSNRAVLSPPSGGFAWGGLDVAYFFLGSLLGGDSAQAVARMTLLDFQSHVGVRYAYGGSGPPVSLFVDELADVVSPNFIGLLNKSRGAHVRITMAAQTLADLEASLGTRARARQIVGNVNAVLQFRAQETDDAEAFAALAGARLLPSTSEGEAYEPSLFTSGFESVEDFRALFSRQRAWRDEALVPPWAVLELPPFHYFGRWGARVVRGAAPLLPDPPLAAVEELKRHAAKSLGLADPDGGRGRGGMGNVARAATGK